MTSTTELSGSRVLVIGGSSGIGRATATLFAAANADVVIASRTPGKLANVAKEIGVDWAALDATDDKAVQRYFEEHAFDHVIASAAQTKSGSVRSLPPADARAALESKFWGAYNVARSARISDGGSLTMVSGFLSRRPSGGAVLQGAINAALEALGRGLALELAPVRVNTVSPGLIATPIWSGMAEADRSAMFARAADRLPVRRVGMAEDVAKAIMFVATNPFVSGSTVTVDGGATIA
ncbi:SDR family oxidoreductase [Sphingomonas sp. BN140010]|uniref:SDR family oxidoreductase n=1 Tax=Sphingomonas arvum TaxID=2992113 RepID=A0ABT3JDP5_9SPHN|nr:SDR family oxidoreductase [Sphingomonas sp. BN140010]MCW3797196.1 SDR family oxidoreductase [Sphingomonas sp. BN140010]